MELYLPRRLESDWVLTRWEPSSGRTAEASPYRAVESLRNFLFPPRLRVAEFPSAGRAELQTPAPVVVAGLKACDLGCLPVLDFIFLKGDQPEPYYAHRRRNTILISYDCTGFKETCFCAMVGGAPFPRAGFDLNLTPLGDHCLVEIGSDKGRELVEAAGRIFAPASADDLRARAGLREKVTGDLRGQLAAQGQLEAAPSAAEVRSRNAGKFWREEARPCVECGACNLVCPTCHCFILEESDSKGGSARWRNWDSCQYPGFTRVAGGANPRARRGQRLSNRFSKKFEFFPDQAGVIACTGCGRCFEACPGKIDIRLLLKKIKTG